MVKNFEAIKVHRTDKGGYEFNSGYALFSAGYKSLEDIKNYEYQNNVLYFILRQLHAKYLNCISSLGEKRSEKEFAIENLKPFVDLLYDTISEKVTDNSDYVILAGYDYSARVWQMDVYTKS